MGKKLIDTFIGFGISTIKISIMLIDNLFNKAKCNYEQFLSVMFEVYQ